MTILCYIRQRILLSHILVTINPCAVAFCRRHAISARKVDYNDISTTMAEVMLYCSLLVAPPEILRRPIHSCSSRVKGSGGKPAT